MSTYLKINHIFTNLCIDWYRLRLEVTLVLDQKRIFFSNIIVEVREVLHTGIAEGDLWPSDWASVVQRFVVGASSVVLQLP